jgi:hypothetical protein
MADIIAVVDENQLFVTTSESQLVTAATDTAAPSVVESLDAVGDIDTNTNGKINGSVLVYRTTTNKWTSTTILDAQDVTGGQY